MHGKARTIVSSATEPYNTFSSRPFSTVEEGGKRLLFLNSTGIERDRIMSSQ